MSDCILPFIIFASGAAAIAAGDYHTCILLIGGIGVECWGQNGNGQLGTGDVLDRFSASAVTGLTAGWRRVEPSLLPVVFARKIRPFEISFCASFPQNLKAYHHT